MSMTIAILLAVLWLLGLLTGSTAGGLIHILLAAAVIIVLAKVTQRVVQRRRTVSRTADRNSIRSTTLQLSPHEKSHGNSRRGGNSRHRQPLLRSLRTGSDGSLLRTSR